jgi:hypothetical protein
LKNEVLGFKLQNFEKWRCHSISSNSNGLHNLSVI